MCVLCAAIPATLAVGVNVNRRQQRAEQDAAERGEEAGRSRLAAKPATLAVVATLIAASVIYHSQAY